MKPVVTIVDYGLGNLFSVARAFEVCGAEVKLADSAIEIDRADRVVLPGVGAFADGMQGLDQRNLVDALRRYAAGGRPLLGICLGMQLLLSMSEEFGTHQGLDLISGSVAPIPVETGDGGRRRIPHIGWSEIMPSHSRHWESTVLDGLTPGTAMYFVHSFTASPNNASDRLADCDYDGFPICASVASGNVSGCQFHPERSGVQGLIVIRNFIGLGAAA